MKFTCTTCGDEHDLSEISFGTDSPAQWHLLTDEERAKSELTEEQCVLETMDGHHFFIRARLQVPIKDSKDSFTWGVWCSLSEKSFIEMSDHWDDPDRIKKGPYELYLKVVFKGKGGVSTGRLLAAVNRPH